MEENDLTLDRVARRLEVEAARGRLTHQGFGGVGYGRRQGQSPEYYGARHGAQSAPGRSRPSRP